MGRKTKGELEVEYDLRIVLLLDRTGVKVMQRKVIVRQGLIEAGASKRVINALGIDDHRLEFIEDMPAIFETTCLFMSL